MEKTEEVRGAVTTLITQYCGDKASKFFSGAYSDETFPMYLHHSFLILKEIAGEEKAREQLNNVLRKYSIVVPYE